MPVNDLLSKAKRTPMEWQSPMLATLTYTYFSHPDWIFECKFDGELCLAYSDEKGVITLYSRNKKILNSTYPELVELASKPKYKSFIVDGEIVAIDKNGISNFSKLQKRIQLAQATKDVIISTPVYFIFLISNILTVMMCACYPSLNAKNS